MKLKILEKYCTFVKWNVIFAIDLKTSSQIIITHVQQHVKYKFKYAGSVGGKSHHY